MQRLGGGEFYLFAHEHGGIGQGQAESLCRLLEVQPYIRKCGWSYGHGEGGICLSDVYTHNYRHGLNLTDMMCDALGLGRTPREEPWLTVPEPRSVAPVVINRCPRWHNGRFPWQRVVAAYGRDAIFVGHLSEFEEFVFRFGYLSYYYTPTYLEAARVIAGAQLFIGNQSSMAAIAEGIKAPMVLETLPRESWWWNCHWERSGKIHGYDEHVELPPL